MYTITSKHQEGSTCKYSYPFLSPPRYMPGRPQGPRIGKFFPFKCRTTPCLGKANVILARALGGQTLLKGNVKILITSPARRAWRSYKFAPFLVFFPCRKSAHRSWVTPLCIVGATTLNSISSGICHQNTQFNMYTTTSKQQEGCTFEDSHPKCFITTNYSTKISRGAVNRGDVHVLRASYTKVNSNTVCNYFNFL